MNSLPSSAPEPHKAHSDSSAWPDGYLKFFELFDRGEYFVAHEVLEALWLPARGTPDAAFYQALIQIAGALVLLQKERPAPALRLLHRASELLAPYEPRHWGLAIPPLRERLRRWQRHIASGRLDARALAARRATAFRLPRPRLEEDPDAPRR